MLAACTPSGSQDSVSEEGSSIKGLPKPGLYRITWDWEVFGMEGAALRDETGEMCLGEEQAKDPRALFLGKTPANCPNPTLELQGGEFIATFNCAGLEEPIEATGQYSESGYEFFFDISDGGSTLRLTGAYDRIDDC